MGNIWSKALFYKEWKNAFGLAVFMTISLILVKVYPLLSELVRLKSLIAKGHLAEQQLYQWFGNMLVGGAGDITVGMSIIITITVVYLFSHERQGATADLLASMPFSKKQIIGTKWLVGILTITIPFVIVFFLISGFYWANVSWINTAYGIVPQWTLINLVVLLTLYSFLFFVQTLMGQNIVAGIIGFICTMIPWYLISASYFVLGEILGLGRDNAFFNKMMEFGGYTIWFQWADATWVSDSTLGWEKYYYTYSQYGLKIGLMLLGIAGLYVLSQRYFARNPLEKNGQLLMFRSLEPVLIWGFAICLGFLGVTLFGMGYGSGRLLMSIYLAIGIVIGYFIARTTVSYYQG